MSDMTIRWSSSKFRPLNGRPLLDPYEFREPEEHFGILKMKNNKPEIRVTYKIDYNIINNNL